MQLSGHLKIKLSAFLVLAIGLACGLREESNAADKLPALFIGGGPSESGCKLVDVALFSRHEKSLRAPALLNDKITATLLVDTGASYTVITPLLATRLGIIITPDTPHISITTANGSMTVPIITMKKIAIGQVEVENVQVMVKDLGSGILEDGLLGLNFFKNMDLIIRQDKLTVCIHNE